MKRMALLFKDGQWVEDQRAFAELPKGVIFKIQPEGIFLHVPRNVQMPLVHVTFFRGQETPVSLQHKIIVEEQACLTWVEEHRCVDENGPLLSTVTDVISEWQLAPFAELNYTRLSDENPAAMHSTNLQVVQEAGSRSQFFTVDCGSQTSRIQAEMHLLGRDSTCDINGLYLLNRDQQTLHHEWKANHFAPFTNSAMKFKGILAKKSKVFFQGKVHVKSEALHVSSHQANHNLLLSSGAEAHAKPELEIYADEIKCTHGATVGQLDSAALFYLQSRGIERSTAMTLLTQAFVADLLEKIPEPFYKNNIEKRINQYEY